MFARQFQEPSTFKIQGIILLFCPNYSNPISICSVSIFKMLSLPIRVFFELLHFPPTDNTKDESQMNAYHAL